VVSDFRWRRSQGVHQDRTSYSGAGAPEQLIGQVVTYYDTIEKRTYTQIGSSWVLTG